MGFHSVKEKNTKFTNKYKKLFVKTKAIFWYPLVNSPDITIMTTDTAQQK